MPNHGLPSQWRPPEMHPGEKKCPGRVHRNGAIRCRFTSSLTAGFFLLFGAILAAPINSSFSWISGVGLGVFAELCSGNGSSSESGGQVIAQEINVTPATDLDLTSVFACEGGDFVVYWSGAVDVPGTIVVGEGTTVRVIGNNASFTDADSVTSTGDGSTSEGSEGSSSLSSNDQIEDLTDRLALPHGLTSAAVGVAPSDITSDTDTSMSFGPMFSVESGQLFLEGLIVRDGFAASVGQNGGGVYAKGSNVSITGCEFTNHFAEISGGGVYVEKSALVVANSSFSGCRAGLQSSAGDDDVKGVGGGIQAKRSNVSINGCLFEGCYASKKGGGVNQDTGKMSVLDSVFFENVAGSNNVADEDEEGRGADLSFKGCTQSFDGMAACGANDTEFVNSHVGKKGGAVAIEDECSLSYIELHRCTVDNSSAGTDIEGDAQGDGGAFYVGQGATLVLANCTLKNNYCGGKGGVIDLSSGGDCEGTPGGIVILRSSSFLSNRAEFDAGGVVYLACFANVSVEGEGNVFEGNTCGSDGAVFAATTDALVTVEGGKFHNNSAKNGGVFWSKGNLTISGGNFIANEASDDGGVISASDDSTTTLEGGLFERNEASNGGVVIVGDRAMLRVTDVNVTGNVAHNEGGAFSVDEGGSVQITGGNFSENVADFGGFLYKKGGGDASCTGASILHHKSGDGGAIYAVDGANLMWACDIGNNSALSGSAMTVIVYNKMSWVEDLKHLMCYARDSASVELRGISLFDNTMARGSVIFLVDSDLKTYQVDFTDSSGSLVLSAVQVDEKSSYSAEDTSFAGFAGEAVVFSEGKLFLDDCDFSGSTSSVLVYSEPGSEAVIRNAVLGDNNYLALATASSQAGELPNADGLTNVDLVCEHGLEASEEESTTRSKHYPCSTGSECLNGTLGVYCQCYEQRSSEQERCVSGNTTALTLSVASEPAEALYPTLVEGDLLLSHGSQPSGSVASSSANAISSYRSGDGNGTNSGGVVNDGLGGGVVWSVETLPWTTPMMTWTIFPSTGLLLPGESITLRVVTLPSTAFDGTTNATFEAIGMSPPSTSSKLALAPSSSDDDAGNSSSSAALQAQGGGTSSSLNVTFYHCAAGTFWNYTGSGANSLEEEYICTCSLCTDGVDGDTEGVDCSNPGATTRTLPTREGYWRAGLGLTYVHECPNKDACKGGSEVQSVDEYCNDGYEGVVCSVCCAGYGRSASNHCHLCTTSFRGAMYFVISVMALFALVVIALLYVYLVRGGDAVSSTVASTKASVRMLKRRGSGMLSRSASGVWSGHGRIELTRSDGLSCRTDDQSRDIERASPTLNGNDVRGTDNEEINEGRTSSSRPDIRAKTNIPHETDGPLTSTTNTHPLARGKIRVRSKTRLPLALEAKNQESASNANTDEAGVVSDSSGAEISQRVFNRAYAGPAAKGGPGSNEPNEHPRSPLANEGDRQTNTSSTRIARILAGLPLSKIKIVIVVWQISSAFAEVTNVTFPPIYETFLSIIGVFSLDLGWILSATCLATEVDFYDKLLIITIGPMVFLSLLGVTFHFGASPIRRDIANETGSATPGMFSTPREVSMPAFVNGRRARIIMSKDCLPLPQYTPHPTAGTLRVQGRAPSEGGLTRTDNVRAKSVSLALNDQGDWVIGSCDEGETEAARMSFNPPRPTLSRSIGASMRSLRNISKAGPGNKTDKHQNLLWGLFARHTTMTLIILYLVYSQVSTVVFQTFACEDYSEISKRYLRADGRIECDTPRHTGYTIYAAVMICLYPLGIPAAFCYLLVRQRSAINPSTDDSLNGSKGREHVMREKINRRKRDQTVAPTSFLWGAYYPNRYYYEVFECMRRLLLTGLLVFVPDTSGQVAYSCIFAFISLWAFELQRPHIDDLEIQLYRTGCLVIFFTNFLALIIQAELADENSNSSAVYSVMLIMVHVFFILSICWNSWATMRAAFSKDHIQGVVLGVDIVGEDSPGTPLHTKTATRSTRTSSDEEVCKIEDADSSPGGQDHGGVSDSSSDMSSSGPAVLSRL